MSTVSLHGDIFFPVSSFRYLSLDYLMSLFKAALYSSTDVANLYLAKESSKSLHDMIIYYSQTTYPLWNNMVDAVRSVASAGRGTESDCLCL